MKSEFNAYLKSLGMGATLVKRVKRIFDFYDSVVPEDIQDMFVSDLLTSEGVREYGSVWFFTEHIMMEAKGWPDTDNWDMLYANQVYYIQVEKQAYAFGLDPTDSSRMLVSFLTDPSNSGDMRATRHNCTQLEKVMRTHLARKMGPSTSGT